jgi:hypothetical protein
MEIKGASQTFFYNTNHTDTKKKSDTLNKFSSSLDYFNQLLLPKLDEEKNFSKISPKEDNYSLGYRSVAKEVSDLKAPLCDTIGGG